MTRVSRLAASGGVNAIAASNRLRQRAADSRICGFYFECRDIRARGSTERVQGIDDLEVGVWLNNCRREYLEDRVNGSLQSIIVFCGRRIGGEVVKERELRHNVFDDTRVAYELVHTFHGYGEEEL